MARHLSHNGEYPTIFDLDQSQNQLAGVGAAVDQFTGRRESGTHLHGPSTSIGSGSGMAALYDAAQQGLTSPVDSMMRSPTGTRHSRPDGLVTGYNYGYQQQQFGQMQVDDRSPKRQRLSGPFQNQESFVAHVPEGDHTCIECGKAKRRECDLRYA